MTCYVLDIFKETLGENYVINQNYRYFYSLVFFQLFNHLVYTVKSKQKQNTISRHETWINMILKMKCSLR